MLYKILFLPARLALHFYCRRVSINRPGSLAMKGPLVLAANHPSSFLDAIILASLFKEPVYSLARGDVFISRPVSLLLKTLNMLPVYRVSEGAQNLKFNFETFDAVQGLLREDKIVLIFSEGKCVNEWHLRPLKKGTARIAMAAWDENIPLKILPVGINYSSFRHFGKHVIINFGDLIERGAVQTDHPAKSIINFNERLQNELRRLVYEIDPDDINERRRIFSLKNSAAKNIFLFLPAMLGYLLHAPMYLITHLIIRNRAMDHYDSIVVAVFFLFYPWYVVLITLLFYLFSGSPWALLTALLMPLTALALLHYRKVVR